MSGAARNFPSPPNRDGVLTVVGDIVEDIIVWRAERVTVGTDNPATVYRARGGSAANVAAAAAGSVATRFIGRVGDDTAADVLVGGLEASGVDVKVQRGGRTGSVVVIVDEAAERTMYPDRAAAAELASIDPMWLSGTDVIHVPAYGLQTGVGSDAVVDAVSRVRAGGGAVSLDASATAVVEALGHSTFWEFVAELRPELLLANADEAKLLGLDRRRPADGCAYVIKNGPDPVDVVTADGSVAQVAPGRVQEVRDTTGAGDAFAGAFLAAWMRGSSAHEACAAGHASAARVLGIPGAGDAGRVDEVTPDDSPETMRYS